VAEAGLVTDSMFAAAADALADEVHADDLAAGSLFPPVRDIRRVTVHVAEAVVKEARDSGVGRQLADADIPEVVIGAMWNPVYLPMEGQAPEAQISGRVHELTTA
jgi:malate dehydrogenase (oxaloacetate-decarboxylating)